VSKYEASKSQDQAATAEVISGEVVSWFSKLHPDVRMPFQHWRDLMEMIEREVTGECFDWNTRAADLCDD